MKKLLIFFCLLIFGCQGSNTEDGKRTLSGKYNYQVFDSTDVLMMEGTLDIKKKGADLSGKYTVSRRAKEFYDLSVVKDSGYFKGVVDETTGKIFFNLNPKLADNNVFVNAEWKDDSTLAGTWRHSTIMGIKAAGSFKAVKMR